MTPAQTALITERHIIGGETQAAVAASLGIARETVCRALSREDIKSRIEQIQSEIADRAYQQSADNVIHAIKSYRTPQLIPGPKNTPIPNPQAPDAQLREHGFKASMRILESIGILPSHAPSVMIQQIFAGNTIVSTDLNSLLSGMFGGKVQEAIDIQYKDKDV